MTENLFSDRAAELREISRYIHNTVSQNLVALSFELSRLEAHDLEATVRAEVESALQLVNRCCADIRLISVMLAPPALSGSTVEAAMEQLAEFVSQESGVRIMLDLDPVSDMVEPESQVLLFAALQAWVGRAIRCQRQPEVRVSLRSRADRLLLDMEMSPPGSVRRDGRFSANAPVSSAAN